MYPGDELSFFMDAAKTPGEGVLFLGTAIITR